MRAMQTRRWAARAGMLLLALALGGCATPRVVGEAALRRMAQTLEARGDAESIAAAGLLDTGPRAEHVWRSSESLDRFLRATTLAPDRTDLLWLAIEACRQVPTCDSVPLEARLRVLDPGNGIAWFGALDRATAAADEAGVEAAVAAIGRSERVDLYWTRLESGLALALSQPGALSVESASATTAGVLAAIAIPPVHILATACRGEPLERAPRRADCQAAAAALERGDTWLMSGVGLGIAQRVWPEGSEAYQRAQAARRQADYQKEVCRRLTLNRWPSAARTHAYLLRLAALRREQDDCRAELVAHHWPLDPPQGWTPAPGAR